MAVLRLFLCLMVLTAGAARADALSDLVAHLAGDSFSDREAAVAALGDLGDGRAIPALNALNDGRLYVASDGRVVIGDPGTGDALKASDPVTGSWLDPVPAGLDRIRVNNRLRNGIAEALGKLKLFSPDRADRLVAAREAARHGSADTMATLRHAAEIEADAEVKAAILSSLMTVQVTAGTKTEQLAAIASLAGRMDPEIRGLLGQLADGGTVVEPEVKAAATAAARAIDRRLAILDYAINLFQGLSLGSVLLLAAIGLAITFGVMGVINMAHGEMIMLGAYTTFVTQEAFRRYLPESWFDAYLIVSIPAAFLVAGAVGAALERSVIRFLYGRPLETLLATWGVSLMLQQLVRTVFGAPNKEVSNPSWMSGGFVISGGFTVTWNRLYIILFCALILLALVAVIRRTAFGLHMRAVTQNRGMAAAMGIPTARVDALTFALGSGVAGMAGVALSQIGNVSPNLGTLYIVDSFMVVVFGGVGNLMGTLVGALGLGIINKFLEPVAGAVLGKIVVLIAIILFIQVRPRGLFALKGRAAEL
ncbi:MAG: urea ABC transporter permease subunit UrtB [Azospirillaceae bacterium]|nr:urea ABC transporter permease subunit UrtB [Azospirillaceae bacterium]